MSRTCALRALLASCSHRQIAVPAVEPPLADTQRACLARAHRHQKAGWIYLHVEGGPAERGFQHGYLLSREIAEGLRVNGVAWEHQTAMSWSWLVAKAEALFAPKIDAENLANWTASSRASVPPASPRPAAS